MQFRRDAAGPDGYRREKRLLRAIRGWDLKPVKASRCEMSTPKLRKPRARRPHNKLTEPSNSLPPIVCVHCGARCAFPKLSFGVS
jgi:hypothetical protein